MQISRHETDLYLLPETTKERHDLQIFAENCGYKAWHWAYSDVSGQSWEGKQFLEIPFGIDLKEQIKDRFNITNCRA
jgi:hypothetical protein